MHKGRGDLRVSGRRHRRSVVGDDEVDVVRVRNHVDPVLRSLLIVGLGDLNRGSLIAAIGLQRPRPRQHCRIRRGNRLRPRIDEPRIIDG